MQIGWGAIRRAIVHNVQGVHSRNRLDVHKKGFSKLNKPVNALVVFTVLQLCFCRHGRWKGTHKCVTAYTRATASKTSAYTPTKSTYSTAPYLHNVRNSLLPASTPFPPFESGHTRILAAQRIKILQFRCISASHQAKPSSTSAVRYVRDTRPAVRYVWGKDAKHHNDNGEVHAPSARVSRPRKTLKLDSMILHSASFEDLLQVLKRRDLLPGTTIHPNERRRATNEQHKQITARKRNNFHSSKADWQFLFSLLKRTTPTLRGDCASMTVRASENKLVLLREAISPLEIRVNSVRKFSHTALVKLSGLPTDLEAIYNFICQEGWANIVHITPARKNNSGAESQPMSYYHERQLEFPDYLLDSGIRRHYQVILPARMALPTIWSEQTFEAYIVWLTGVHPARLDREILGRFENLRGILEYLFEEIAFTAVTPTNVSMVFALRYMIKHSLPEQARSFFDRLISRGFQPGQNDFNHFLRRCAKVPDLDGFHYFLQRMIHHNIRPDWQVWVSLMLMGQSVDDKQSVLLEMHQRGYVDQTDVARDLVQEVVEYGFGSFLDEGGSVQEYVQNLFWVYGPMWLSKVAVDRMIHVLSERLRYHSALTLIRDLMAHWDFEPGASTLKVLLVHCVRQQDMDLAVHFVNLWHKEWQVRPERIGLDRLFLLSLQNKLHNCARVIWKYSCTSGHLSFSASHHICDSLVRSQGQMGHSPNEKFRFVVGAVVCGERPLFSSSRAVNKSCVESLMNSQRRLFKVGTLVRPFADMLSEAWAMDKEWKEKGHNGTATDIAWKIDNAIHVPIKIEANKHVFKSASPLEEVKE